MMRFFTLVLVCWAACLPGLGWADEESYHATSGRLKALVDPLPAPGALAAQPSGSIFQTSLASTFVLAPYTSTRLRDLAPETDGPRVKGLISKTSWLKGRLTTETEIASSEGGSTWLENRMAGDQRMDPSKQMIRLGASGIIGTFRYGATYRTAGRAFLIGPDLANREMWGEWKAHGITLRSAVGQLWNNVDEDAARQRLTQTYGRMTVGLVKPAWPDFTLTYTRNSLSSLIEPLGIAPQRMHTHSLEGAVAYQSLRWNVRLTSTYALTSDLLRSGAESNVRIQLLTASFRPLNTFTISPTLGYREEMQDASGTRIDGPSASLALQYRQSRQLLISAMGNYASSRSNDRIIDHENIGGKGVVAWDVQQSSTWSALIAIEAGYTRVSNRVTPAADSEDISGLVRLVLADL